MQGDCDGSRREKPPARRQRKSFALQEKQGVHELEPKSDDGEIFGLCETTSERHWKDSEGWYFGGLTHPQCEMDFIKLTLQNSL